MAELVIAALPVAGFDTFDMIKVYKNGYYRHWKNKGVPLPGTFIVRLPLIDAREIKRLFIRGVERNSGHSKRQFRVLSIVNPYKKPCVTKWGIYIGKWIKSK